MEVYLRQLGTNCACVASAAGLSFLRQGSGPLHYSGGSVESSVTGLVFLKSMQFIVLKCFNT
jgi:hypothetical protein